MSEMKTALVIDDHPLVHLGCAQILRDCGYGVVLEAHDCASGLQAAERGAPDLIVADLTLPDGPGLEVIPRLAALRPGAPILACSMHEKPVFAARALEAGAQGFLSKNDPPAVFRAAIAAVERGEVHLSHRLALEVATLRTRGARDPLESLTERERRMMALLREGHDLSGVASRLGVSYRTAASLSASVKEKLGARSFADLLRLALREGA